MMHTARLCGANNGTIGWSSYSCVHCRIDKNAERTFNAFSFSLWMESSQTWLEVLLCNEGHAVQRGKCQWRANSNNTGSSARFESCSAIYLSFHCRTSGTIRPFSSHRFASLRCPFSRLKSFEKRKQISTQKGKQTRGLDSTKNDLTTTLF